MLELTNQREAWQKAAKPPLKEKKNNDSGREFNLGDSEKPDELFS